jgi:hypothetical protein
MVTTPRQLDGKSNTSSGKVKMITDADVEFLRGPGSPNFKKFLNLPLYRHPGPVASDVVQGKIGDCSFMATLASVANQQPGEIKKAITEHQHSNSYTVSLFNRLGKQQTINLTYQDLATLLTKHDVQLLTCRWPIIIETAYAKMNDSDPKDGIDDGIDSIDNGRYVEDAMLALVGFQGTGVSYIDPQLNRLGSQATPSFDGRSYCSSH